MPLVADGPETAGKGIGVADAFVLLLYSFEAQDSATAAGVCLGAAAIHRTCSPELLPILRCV